MLFFSFVHLFLISFPKLTVFFFFFFFSSFISPGFANHPGYMGTRVGVEKYLMHKNPTWQGKDMIIESTINKLELTGCSDVDTFKKKKKRKEEKKRTKEGQVSK